MLYFRESGSGQPVVLIHGLFGSLENLGAVARLLAQDFRVLSVDLPNHGRSPHSTGADLAFMAGAVARWLAEQGLVRPSVVGHSLGGKVAMELALAQPERVGRLVVIDIAPVNYPPRHDDVFAGLKAIDAGSVRNRTEAEDLLQQHINEAPVRSFLLKNLVKEEEGFRWRMHLQDLENQYDRLIQGNRDGVYPGPVLFLKGENSDYIKPAYKDLILAKFPLAESRVIAGTGHWLHAEKPELTASLIKKFLQSEQIST